MGLNSESSTDPEHDSGDGARPVKITGKLLTGDEIKFHYVCMSTSVEGKVSTLRDKNAMDKELLSNKNLT